MLRSRGFTLIELLVVIAIIGILSTIVLASLNTARLKSRDARRIADIKQLQLALAVFYDSKAGYPSALSCLASGGYISSVPKDPSTNADYPYTPLGSGLCNCASVSNVTSYHLGAALEDPSNSALLNDTDALASGETKCTGGQTNPFDGTSKSCDTAGGTEQCYDVTP
jgi:general secretion pathway protein G